MVYSLFLTGFFVGRVTLEGARQGEFAQLVAHHLVGNVDRHVLLAVVHGDGQADELGRTMERRDQVLTGFLSLVAMAFSTLASK